MALGFVLSLKNVSSVIPNITTMNELENFAKSSEILLEKADVEFLFDYYERNYRDLNQESIRETIIYK